MSVAPAPGCDAGHSAADTVECTPGPAGVVPLSEVLQGVPASPGVASGRVQVVRGPGEVGIPAVLAVPRAAEVLKPPSAVTVDGDVGHVSIGAS